MQVIKAVKRRNRVNDASAELNLWTKTLPKN